jgi:hypothetical protein
MAKNWQNYLALGIIALVVILIAVKVIINYSSGAKWTPEDRVQMVSDCLDDLGGYAVRFPMQSEEYCACTTDTILASFSRAEYKLIEKENTPEDEKKVLKVISECYNAYQQAMFNASKLD